LSSRLDSLIVSNFPIHPSSFARMSFFFLFFFFHYAHISREPIRNFSENSREWRGEGETLKLYASVIDWRIYRRHGVEERGNDRWD
jgi:hypothetical protein